MGQRWLEEKEHATFVYQFSNLLTLNGLLVPVCGEQHACICIANIFKWENNEGQHVCRSICVVLRHQTTVVFRAKGKGTPPPPGRLPKGASSGKRPTSILLRKGFNIYGTHLFAIQPSLATRWPLVTAAVTALNYTLM